MKHPLSRLRAFPLSLREGDDSLAAGRPLLAVSGLWQCRFCTLRDEVLSRLRAFPLSLQEGDDSLAPRQPLLAVSVLWQCRFCALRHEVLSRLRAFPLSLREGTTASLRGGPCWLSLGLGCAGFVRCAKRGIRSCSRPLAGFPPA